MVIEIENKIGVVLAHKYENDAVVRNNYYILNDVKEIIELNVFKAEVKDISFLKKCKALIKLSLIECHLERIDEISLLKNLRVLNLQVNNIGDYSKLKNLKNLKELRIEDGTIDNYDFIPKKIEVLSINHCKIPDLVFLSDNVSLRVLNLSNNDITSLIPLKRLNKIEVLNLSNNKIDDISVLKNLQNLEDLNLSCNKIEDIDALRGLKFKNLYLGKNDIMDLTPLYQELKNGGVEMLNVHENPLKYPPKPYGFLDDYEKWRWFENNLDFARDKIKECKVSNGKILNLGNCGLTDLSLLPELFEGLANLEELILSNVWAEYDEDGEYWKRNTSKNRSYPNNISQIPIEIRNLKNLRKLIIGGDWKEDDGWNRWRIDDLTPIFKLNKLEHLNVSNNVIEKIVVQSTPKLTELKVLHLNNNRINTFDTLSKFPNLEELYLSNNEITTVDNIKNLSNLKSVDLHSNQITTLKPLVDLLKRSSIDITDSKWKKNTINVKDNPIKQPNFETILSGKQAIIRYFESEWKKIINKEIKLILVGNSEVGKTTLVKYLDDEKNLENAHDATHWMIEKDINSKQIINKLNDKCNLRVFDFGGQDYYHDTHQIFFTGSTIYLLLWEKATNTINKRLLEQAFNGVKRMVTTQDYPVEYWLESIKHFTKIKSNILDKNDKITFEYDSKTLIIQNKVFKGNQIYHLNNEKLSDIDKYPFIYDFININIINGRRNLEHFDCLLTEIINEMEKVGEEVLEYQHIIRNHLKEYNDTPILNLDDFVEYCNSKLYRDITELEAKDLCVYLKHLGLIFYLPDYSKIYINKSWVFECIHKILEGLFEAGGEFDESYVEEIVNEISNVVIDGFVKDSIVELMLEHKIIFKNPITKKFIAPLYLSNEPEEGVSLFLLEDRMPYRRFEYNSFIHKTFILDFYSKYGSKTVNDGKKFYYWKDGLIIKDEFSNQILHIKFNNACENGNACIDIFKLNDTDKKNIFVSEVIQFIKYTNNKFFKIDEKDIKEKRVDIEDYYEELVTVNNKDYVSYPLIQKYNEEKKFVFSQRKLIDLKENKKSLQKNLNLIDFKQFIEKKNMINKIFISYSKKDLGMVNIFQDHLAVLERDRLLNTWYCTELKPGEEWNESIQNHFEESNIICFMISPNFMKTDYIFEYELRKSLERKKNGDDNFIIIPIIMDFCIWVSDDEDYNLGKYTALPFTAKPITDFDNQNAAWLIISECIKTMIKEKKQPEGDNFFSEKNYYKNNQLRDLFERLVRGELNKKNK